MQSVSITPLSAALGEVILETRFLEQRWPHAAERATLSRAMFELHTQVSDAVVSLDGKRREIDEGAANLAREGFLATLTLAVLIQRMIVRARRGRQQARRQLAASAMFALRRLMDALDPFIARADAALRRVMLEGVSSEQAASQIALPV
jgi:hypothetical protein